MDRYATLRHGLVAAWCPSLRPAGGYVLPDTVGRHNATITAATWQPMTGGGTLAFNGTTAVASNSSAQVTLNGAATASQSMWLWKPAANTTAASGFTNSTVSTGGNRFSVTWFSDGNCYVICENSSTSFAVVGNNVAGWMHLAFVFDGRQTGNTARLQVWVNGRQNGPNAFINYTGTIPATLSENLGPYTLGKDSSDRFAAGRVDDVRLYNRRITQTEIRLLASQRGIGLVPTRNRRGALVSQAWLNVAGTWKTAKPWINVGGTWRQGSPKIRAGGAWKG